MDEVITPPATAPLELADPTKGKEGDPTELELAKKLLDEYKVARAFDRPAHRMIARDRRYASGVATADWAVSANLLGSYIDILVAFIYARNPKTSIRPAEQTGQAAQRERQLFSQTLQIVVQRLWKDGKLKKCMKRVVRAGYSVGTGWFKAVMLFDTANDPVIEHELNDLRDNIDAVRAAEEALFDPENGSDDDPQLDREGKIRELELLIEGLTAKVEVVLRKGMAIDFVPSEQLQVWVDVRDIDDYLESCCIADEIFILKNEVLARFPRLTANDLTTATIYYQKAPQEYGARDAAGPDGPAGIELAGLDGTMATGTVASQYSTSQAYAGVNTDATGRATEYCKIIEAWDKRDNHIKTLVEGIKKWAKEPFVPQFATSRFYPYFKVDFFPVDGERFAQSLTWRLSKLQDEYGGTRSNFRLTRQRAIPATLFNSAQIEEQDMKKIVAATQDEFVGVKPRDTDIDFNKLFAPKPTPAVDVGLFDTSMIIGDMEKLSGVQEALQTSQTVDKTATQAEIEQSGFAARTTAARDCVEETLSEFARYTAELALQALTYNDVVKIAGPLAFWPEGLPIEAITSLLDIDIEAGSTGRPNTAAERDAWIQIEPMLERLIPMIIQLQGTPLGMALIEIVRETLARFDDRIDIERFLPGIANGAPGLLQPIDPVMGARGPTGAPMAPPIEGEVEPAPPGMPGSEAAAAVEVLPENPQLAPPVVV
jgi:hypothetical protein